MNFKFDKAQLQGFFQNLYKQFSFTPHSKEDGGKSKRRLGLNIGRTNMVAVEVLEQNGQLILERYGLQPVNKSEPLGKQIKAFIAEFGFQSKRVNVSLKGHGIVVRFLSFPRMNRTDFASSIQFEAEKYLPFNISEVFIDFHINEVPGAKADGGTTMPVILAAARKTEVQRLIDAAKTAGLEIRSIDVDIFACANAFEYAHADAKNRVVALVDFGAQDTTFMIWNEGILVFSRDIAFGGDDTTESIRRKLNVEWREAFQFQCKAKWETPEEETLMTESLERLLHELTVSLNYYYNQHPNAKPLEGIYISGGFSQCAALPALLEKKMNLPVKKWDPTAKLELGGALKREMLEPIASYLPVSVGLAIRSK